MIIHNKQENLSKYKNCKYLLICLFYIIFGCEKSTDEMNSSCSPDLECQNYTYEGGYFEFRSGTFVRNDSTFGLSVNSNIPITLDCSFHFDQTTNQYSVDLDLPFNTRYGLGFPRIKYDKTGFMKFTKTHEVIINEECNYSFYHGNVQIFDTLNILESKVPFTHFCSLYDFPLVFGINIVGDSIVLGFDFRK